MNFSRVLEETKEPYFTVKHKLFWVPIEDYRGALSSYLDPFSEEAVQKFVESYLGYRNDPGIVGLVGLERQEDCVLIDAAVRYERE